MTIQFSDRFTYGKLIKFTLPSIAMMIFTSIYSVVDGFFGSNFAGKVAFSAVNLIMPFLMIVETVGFMFAPEEPLLLPTPLVLVIRKRQTDIFPCLCIWLLFLVSYSLY